MLFQTQVSSQANHRLDATLKPETTQETRTVACERVLRKRRSQKYIDAMSKLDAGSGHISQEDIDKQLYEKYDLDEKEIAFIESMIRPME